MSVSTGTTLSSLSLIDKLANHFYEVVPDQYRTYCAFTSRIIEKVLTHFGLTCECLPCQLWYTQQNHIYVIGFLGQETPGKWDGHVVCCANNTLIDAATHHFEREFGLKSPWVVVAPRFTFPTPALAHANVNGTDAIWWQPPPPHVNTAAPEQPEALMEPYVQALIERLSS